MATDGGWSGWQVRDAAGRRKYLSIEERGRFLDAADCLTPASRALCHVLAHTGCRISEALALTIDHIDVERLTLTIRTLKRRRTVFRTLPVPQEVIDMLRALPLDTKGRFWPMHRATAWRMVKAVMKRATVAASCSSPKGLRHGFGMCAAGHSIPISLIQRWLGHSSPLTTAIYLDAVGAEEYQFASRMWRD